MRDFVNFIGLKTNALRCKDKNKGKMLNRLFRLFYNEQDDTVDLINRCDDTLLVSTNNKDIHTLWIKNRDIAPYIINHITRIYNVKLKLIGSKQSLKSYNSHFIIEYSGDKKYVYIPMETKVKEGRIIEIADYIETTIDKKWNKAYTQTSKLNRAAFAAMNGIIPFEPIDTTGMYSFEVSRLKRTYFQNATSQQILLNLVLSTPNPNGGHIEILRKEFNIKTDKIKIRKPLQNLINSNRYSEAIKYGKIILTTKKNSGF